MSESSVRVTTQLPQAEEKSARSDRLPIPGSDADRQFRRATLNLLEDAIRARSETVAVNRQLEAKIAEHEQSKISLSNTQQQLQEAICSFEKLKNEFNERVQERTKEFEQREIRLQDSASQIKKAELRDRKRLARLLHDQVQQLLIAVKIRVSMIPEAPGSLETLASDVMAILDDAVNVTRDVAVQLAPPLLHDEGLPAALDWLVSRTAKQFRMAITPHIDPSANPASVEGRDILFQAAQEFLLNAAKHSNCTNVKLRLSRSSRQIALNVQDNGNGFDISVLQGNGSFGLFEVTERLSSVGGQFKMDSRPGEGTSAMAIVPAVQVGRAIQNGTFHSPSINTHFSDSESIRVVLIDDHQVVREGVAQFLRRYPGIQVVGEAGDGIAGLQLACELQPDIIVMDMNMPQMNGIEATRRILSSVPDSKIIGLSLEESPAIRQAFLDAGAVRYLMKDSSLEKIVETIEEVAKTTQCEDNVTANERSNSRSTRKDGDG